MATSDVPAGEYVPTADRRIVLRDVGWSGYRTVLALRGDGSGPRITYLDGAVELMGPAYGHEHIGSRIGALIEAYCVARGIEITPVGSWTLEGEPDEAAVEPDECYHFGSKPTERPDIAIEVVWTSGGLNKLEVYRRLGVREVWFWKNEKLSIFELVAGTYERRERSPQLPDLDIDLVRELIEIESFNEAVTRMRAAATPH